MYRLIQITVFYGTTVFCAGVPTALTKFLSGIDRNDGPRISEIFRFIYLFFCVVFLLLAIGPLIVSATFGGSLLLANDPVWLVSGLLLCMGTLGRALQDATFSGFQEFSSIAKVRIAEGIIFAAFGPLMAIGFGPYGALSASFLTMAFALAFGLTVTAPEVRSSLMRPRFERVVEIARMFLSFSVPTTIAILAPALALLISVYSLGWSDHNLIQTALYNAAYQWLGPITFVPMALAAVGFPMLSKAWASGNRVEFSSAYLRLILIALAITVGLSALLFCTKSFLAGAYGQKFHLLADLFLWIALAAPGKVAMDISIAALQASDRSKWLLLMTFTWTLLFLVVIWLNNGGLQAETILKALALSYFAVGVVVSLLIVRNVRARQRES